MSKRKTEETEDLKEKLEKLEELCQKHIGILEGQVKFLDESIENERSHPSEFSESIIQELSQDYEWIEKFKMKLNEIIGIINAEDLHEINSKIKEYRNLYRDWLRISDRHFASMSGIPNFFNEMMEIEMTSTQVDPKRTKMLEEFKNFSKSISKKMRMGGKRKSKKRNSKSRRRRKNGL